MASEQKELKLSTDQFVLNENGELVIKNDELAQVIQDAKIREASTEQAATAGEVEVGVSVKVKF